MKNKYYPVEVTQYQCPICKVVYPTKDECLECVSKGVPKNDIKVGDIVTEGGGYGWFNGDKQWVVNYRQRISRSGHVTRTEHTDGRNCFESCCCIHFYYVVGRIEEDPRDRHRKRYYLVTDAMTGSQGHRFIVSWRDYIKKVSNPPKALLKRVPQMLRDVMVEYGVE